MVAKHRTKHASKDGIGLAVFEVGGEFLLVVRVLGLRLAVLLSEFFYAFFLVLTVIYDTQTCIQ